MPTDRSVGVVEELTAAFKESPLVLATEYRGLDVPQLQGLRKALRDSQSDFKIAKNTLARIAADQAGRPELKDVIDGPIGFVTCAGDPAVAAKALVKYLDDNKLEVKIIGGLLDVSPLDASRVKALADLPSREVLLAKMLGGMNAPITGLVTVLSGPVRALANVLQRHIEKQGEAAAA